MSIPQARTNSRKMDSSALPIRTVSANSAEDSSGSAEERVRKFQKTNGGDNRLRKPNPNITSAPRPPPADSTKPTVRGRQKAPLGPRERPHDFTKQRVASGSSVSSSDNRSFLPMATSEATATHPSNPRFSFSKQPDVSKDTTEVSGSYDFLPSVNFDDFANSLAYEPNLSDFPAPGSFKGTASANSSTNNMPSFSGNPAESRPTRSNSLMRRFSHSSSRKSSNPPPTTTNATATSSNPPASTDASAMPPPAATNLSIRSRRQSQLPAQAPPNPAARAPRKSVGPGMLPTGSFDRFDLPKLNTDTSQTTRIGRTPSFNKGNRRGPMSATVHNSATETTPKAANTTRSAKAKSLQAPSRHTPAHLSASTMTPDRASLSVQQARSPGKSPAQRTHTPSSSASKRQSTMHHLGGLGARTISPTDARRLKRLSMNPNPPGGPISPPTPQAEFSFDDRAFSQSPSMIFRKSVTPSSARGTPDQNRKSYASGISLSSNSSLSSLRLGTSAMPTRPNPTLTSSRLPTPKGRNVHSSTGQDEEDVPPVPAIPKAYESPKDPERSSFSFSTSALKPNIPPPPSQERAATEDVNSTQVHDTGSGGVEPPKADPLKKSKGSIRHRRGLTVGSGSEADKTPAVQHSSKKNLQPIRLPPLNLLPLGTPFNNRMSSFPVPSAEVDDRTTTPPPKRAANKTPSTPMTASKASFFSKSGHQEQYEFNNHLRSSSSAYNLRSSESSFGGASAMPIPTLNPTRQMTTPFASNSLPKGSGEFARLYSRPSGEFKAQDTDVELQNMRIGGPRTMVKKDNTSDSAHTSTSTEPETPSSGSSLRRKLSLSGWRRASSKAATHPHVQQNSQPRSGIPTTEEQAPQPPKHSEMPPPKLPASATWSGSAVANSPNTGARTRPSLDFTRRKPSATTIASDTEVEKPSAHRKSGSISGRATSGFQEQSGQPTPKSSSSLLTPMQRMLGSKSSSNVLKSRNLDPNLDRDDLVADEEMKRLASKRKDFEHAARDVDDLRKRARPQERVTPAQALQMVNLNIFERGEIIDYKEVYFCGTKSAKKHVGDLNAQTANFGYDDDRGDYNIVLGDHLAYRYEVVDLLGKGSFGQVVRCVDHKTGALVAIKIIRNKKRFHQQALVEVNILQKLREWDPDNKHSMINFTQSFYFRGHLCISTELLGMNLYEFIKAHEFKGFSLRLIRRFCKQMLSSLVLLKGHRVIHCDLKPENILLAHPLHSEIKVIDFGSSCFENEKVYTYIQSRFYRSPEVILGMSYGLPIDMWSLGCILAELLTGYPIFPGENEQEQLACIMEIFGPPEKHLIEKSSRKKLFFDSLGKPRVTVSSKGRRRRPSSKTLQQALKCDDEAFLDFIARCLRWDPDRRMKPDEAMLHEFITGLRKPARPRPQTNGSGVVSSPVKRIPPSQTPQSRVRPLPEPPATSFKNGTAVNSSRDLPSGSPVKGAPRRHSTVQGAPGGTGVKRTATGAPLNATSSLPRAAQRSVSGKPDLASAAAVASLTR